MSMGMRIRKKKSIASWSRERGLFIFIFEMATSLMILPFYYHPPLSRHRSSFFLPQTENSVRGKPGCNVIAFSLFSRQHTTLASGISRGHLFGQHDSIRGTSCYLSQSSVIYLFLSSPKFSFPALDSQVHRP